MSAKRTGHPEKRVTFQLPSSSPQTSTASRALNNHSANRRRFTANNRLPSTTPNNSPKPQTAHALRLPRWPFNEQDTRLISAGYQPQWTPNPPQPEPQNKGQNRSAMAEPRARMARHKGQMNFQNELRLLLLAYGDPSPHPSFPNEPLPETVRVLDEIVTDFVLEVCHGAAQVAHHARRQKIKVEDFRFALRRDPNKLGRVQELLRMERELKEARKAFDQNDDQVAKEAGKKGAAAAAAAVAAGEDPEAAEAAAAASVTGKKGKNKGKGKRDATRRGSDATEESAVKKRKTIG
ncbi:unnamed protein product [Penicillium olsonii]|nr:unnamed protein product [Penicillium olsonii]CAG7934376.1 unnamed protein product [Penicillium olsonii]